MYLISEEISIFSVILFSQDNPLFVATFYNQPAVTDFIIDILVGSTQTDIRDVALEQFYILAQTETTPREQTSTTPTPQSFMLNTLLKARLPFWVTVSNSTRGASYRWVFVILAKKIKKRRKYLHTNGNYGDYLSIVIKLGNSFYCNSHS